MCLGAFAFLLQTASPQTTLRPLQVTGHIISKISVPPFSTLATFAADSRGQPPIVLCGNTDQPMCNLCDLYVLVRKIIDFLLFQLALPIAVIVALIGGILILVSAGDTKKLEQGKSALTNAVVGIIIAFAAWLLINTVLTTLAFRVPFTSGALPWNEIPVCQAPIQTAPPTEDTSGLWCVKTPELTDITGSCSKISESACTDMGGTPWQTRPSNCALLQGYCKNMPTGTFGACDPSVNCEACTNAGGECTETAPPSCAGTCKPVGAGPCSVSSLSGGCMGGNAANASQICNGESGGSSIVGSKADKTITPCPTGIVGAPDSSKCSFSWGLFQINIAANDVSGLGCPSAFQKTGGVYKIINPSLFAQCVREAQKESVNIAKACQMSGSGSNFGKDWKIISKSCNIP